MIRPAYRTTLVILVAAAGLVLGACGSADPEVEVTDAMRTDALARIAADEMPAYESWQMQETDDGVRFVELVAGSGDNAWYDDEVRVHYKLWLPDGSFVDSTFPNGVSTPFEFTVGDTRRVIEGWHEIIQEMNEGSEVLAVIPWQLGYGRRGRGEVPGRTDLVFAIRVLRIR